MCIRDSLKYAPEDAHFRKLAEDIIMAQTSEIEQMKNMMEDIKSGYQMCIRDRL